MPHSTPSQAITTLLTPQEFKRLREQLAGFHWDHGLQEFCQVTGLSFDRYGGEKWEAFACCIKAMQQVPDAVCYLDQPINRGVWSIKAMQQVPDAVWDALLVEVQQPTASSTGGRSQ